MRCPKCSFISFDVVETCVKCGKDISAAAEELNGTVASMAAPEFLKFEFNEPEADEAVAETADQEEEEAFDLGSGDEEEAFDLGSDEEEVAVDLSPEEEDMEIVAESDTDEFTADAADVEAEAPEALEAEPEEDEAGMDIADLAPSAEEAEFEVEEEVSEDVEVAEDQPAPEDAGQGLEDLQVEGIDLEASSAPPAGEKGKVMPSVKTGTALDDFDIDLGDLLPK